MCLLSYFTPGAAVVRGHLETGCASNPDGFGWALTAGDRIYMDHSMTAVKALDQFMEARDAFPDSHAIFHSRYTTDGLTTLDNCHPFYVGDRTDTVVGHNGILPQRPGLTDPRSDTALYAAEIMPARFMHLDGRKTKRRVEKYLGAGSRLVVLTVDPAFKSNAYLYNESHGTWVDGVWHSNEGYQVFRHRYVSSYGLGSGVWSRTVRESWSEQDGASYDVEDWEYVCTACEKGEDDCRCAWPTWVGRERQEDLSDSTTWKCTQCQVVGWIDEDTGQCRLCDFMWCCETTPDECECDTGPNAVKSEINATPLP